MTDALATAIVDYIDARLDSMVKYPGTWGSPESLELQALMLLELRSFVLRPSAYQKNPRETREAYFAVIKREFPNSPPVPMARILAESGQDSELPSMIAKMLETLTSKLGAENPMYESDLVLNLEFKPFTETRFVTVCDYYGTFQRSLQMLAVRDGRPPREVRNEIIRLTTFPVPGLRTTPANGVGPRVMVPLVHREDKQLSLGKYGVSARERIRDSLGKIVKMMRWANGKVVSPARVVKMFHGKNTMRTFAAKVIDMLPTEEQRIARVEIGGDLIPAHAEAVLLAMHGNRLRRLLEVNEPTAKETITGDVRAFDRDQLWFRVKVGGDNVKCWTELNPRHLDTAVEAAHEGRPVEVTGWIYRAERRVWLVTERVEMKPSTGVMRSAALLGMGQPTKTKMLTSGSQS